MVVDCAIELLASPRIEVFTLRSHFLVKMPIIVFFVKCNSSQRTDPIRT